MAQADSQRAIGAVTRLLQDHLNRRALVVTVGRPDEATAAETAAKLNLFLYEISFDGAMRNLSLEEGRPPPVWLTLHYLLSAFDDDDRSDSAAAHELLGRGLMALNDLNYLRLDATTAMNVRRALEMNPEPLKLTFEDSSSDLLSKLMQGAEDSYRLSAAVQVRPVLLMPAVPEPSSLLVGVDYSRSPPAEIGTEGVRIDTLPGLGPVLERVTPAAVEPGGRITVHGHDLDAARLEAVLGGVVLRIVAQKPDRLVVEVEGTPTDGGAVGPIAAGRSISAGAHPLSVRQSLPGGRYRGSKLLELELRPVVTGATLAGADLQLTGQLLGGASDDVVLTLLRDGVPVRSFEAVMTTDDQQSLTVSGIASVGAGSYLALLRVNGQPARVAPRVVVS
ncbi:Pvc16 family protein [Pararhodobacter sp. SW119]|uniref:Pvc16 family protein n=1 Tax=Pararhodobacter sp. SW119 TaxID=2780075 RepID=UPI001ADF067B|nr:Pvc16 family protein [Pararhodobacter sp. SW119]